MLSLLLHPGDLVLSQWITLFFVWIVAPIGILYFILKYLNKRRNGPK
jgi:hypothetical protein